MKIIKEFKWVLVIAMIAGMTLHSCSDEEYSTEESVTQQQNDQTKNPLANVTTRKGWLDSFEVNGKCYCKSTYDHGIGNYKVNGRTVRDICEEMKSKMQAAWDGPGKKTFYNTVQCGHEPAHTDKTINGHPDEVLCPGEVGDGIKCNSRKGPKWDLDGNGGDNKPPTVSFATPANNASVKVGYGELYVKVNASDSDGSIAEIRMYIDDNYIRTERLNPYEWGNGSNKNETLGLTTGMHILKAVAKDNDGATTTVTRTIEVTKDGGNSNAPSVSFAAPANDISLKQGYGSLYIKANASDANGSITEVKLYIDNKFIRTEKVDPYEWGHGNRKGETLKLSVGAHTLRVEATDNDGNTTSATRTVTITN